jgi:hypothetical protein
MSALSVQVPFPVFQGRDGKPLSNGYIWLGVANLDPQTNPVIAYYDEALTIIAPQPLRTINGYVSRAGSPAQIYVDAVNFSILVQDSNGSMVYNFPSGTGIGPNASGVIYDPAGTGAVATTVQAKLRESVSVKDFGAVGNGIVNDTAAIQAAITATVAGGTLFFPAGDYIISSQLTVSKAITIRGSTQYQTAIIAAACSGFLISLASHVQIHNLEIAASVRHTITPNAYIGIDVAGSTGTRPFNHVYRDVFIDGFFTGYRSAWLWSSTFSNFKTGACAIGIKATNLSANNVVSGCSFSGAAGLAGSRGIQLDGNVDPTEGWMISDTLIDDFEVGIEGIAATHVYISNCIIDHNRVNGILISGSGANFGGNWIVRGCYVAMQGSSGDVAIKSTNAASNTQNRGNIITGNQVLVYTGSTCINGIQMSGSQAVNNVITDNTIKGFSTYDIRTNTGPDIVTNNSCQSAIATNLLIAGSAIVKNNRGVLNFAEFTQFETLGQNKVTWSYSIPTTGTWTQGDICWKSNTAAGGIPGWICTTGGTPGTWKAMAAVAA